MPNWTITPALDQSLKDELSRLLQLRIDRIQQGFPLTFDQVQRAVVPAWVLDSLKALSEAEVASVRQEYMYRISASFAGEEFKRGCVLDIQMDYTKYAQTGVGFIYMYKEQIWTDSFDETRHEHKPFDLDTLDGESRAKLVEWINLAVREHRIVSGTTKMAHQFLYFCPTLAHLDARWPDLKILFSKLKGEWSSRIRNLPRKKLQRWDWPTYGAAFEWWVENRERMEVAASIIVGATMIDRNVELTTPEITARVHDWDRTKLVE